MGTGPNRRHRAASSAAKRKSPICDDGQSRAAKPATIAPPLVPASTSTGIPARSNASSTPTCANARAPPPPITNPMRRWRANSALADRAHQSRDYPIQGNQEWRRWCALFDRAANLSIGSYGLRGNSPRRSIASSTGGEAGSAIEASRSRTDRAMSSDCRADVHRTIVTSARPHAARKKRSSIALASANRSTCEFLRSRASTSELITSGAWTETVPTASGLVVPAYSVATDFRVVAAIASLSDVIIACSSLECRASSSSTTASARLRDVPVVVSRSRWASAMAICLCM